MLERVGRAVWKLTAVTGYLVVNLPWLLVKAVREGPRKSVRMASQLADSAERSVEVFQRMMETARETVEAVREGRVFLPELEEVPFRDLEIRGVRIAAAPRMPWDIPALILQLSLIATVIFTVLEEVIVPPVFLWEILSVLSVFVAAFSLGWLRRVSPFEDHWRPYRHATTIILGAVFLSVLLTNVPPLVALMLPIEMTLPGLGSFGIPLLGVVLALVEVRRRFDRDWTLGVVLERAGENRVVVVVGSDLAANTLPGEYEVEGDAEPGTLVVVKVRKRPFSVAGSEPYKIAGEWG